MNADDLAKEHSYGFLQDAEVDAVRHIAYLCKEKCPVIVNLGAGAGTTAMAFLEASECAKVYTIDNWQFALDRERKSFEKVGITPPIQILSDSDIAGTIWHEGEVDIVFIDACHEYEAVKKDILAWMPHLKVGGLMGFHDVDHPNYPGVRQAVEEFFNEDQLTLTVRTVRAYRIP